DKERRPCDREIPGTAQRNQLDTAAEKHRAAKNHQCGEQDYENSSESPWPTASIHRTSLNAALLRRSSATASDQTSQPDKANQAQPTPVEPAVWTGVTLFLRDRRLRDNASLRQREGISAHQHEQNE